MYKGDVNLALGETSKESSLSTISAEALHNDIVMLKLLMRINFVSNKK